MRARLGSQTLIALAVVGGFGATVALMVGAGTSFLYDEAVYGAKARELATGLPALDWAVFRPPGLAVLGILGGVGGWSDGAMRAIALVLGCAAVAAAGLLARVVFGSRAELVAVVVTAGAPTVLWASSVFLNDLAAAGIVLASMALLWRELEQRAAPTIRLLLVGPLWAAAFYVRYGAVLVLAAVTLAAAVLWWRTLWRHRRLVAATVLGGLALAVPHVVLAVGATGVPWGILMAATEVTRTASIATTAGRYAAWLVNGELGGGLGLAVVVAALAGGIGFLARYVRTGAAGRHDARATVWLGLPAIVMSGPIVASAAAEHRYALPPLLLAIVLGSGAAARAATWLAAEVSSRRIRNALGGAALVAAALLVAACWRGAIVGSRDTAAAMAWLKTSATLAAADSGGNCAVVTSWPQRPSVYWYTACPVAAATTADRVPEPWKPGGRIGYALIHHDPNPARRMPDEVVEAYRRMAVRPPLAEFRGPDGRVVSELLRVTP